MAIENLRQRRLRWFAARQPAAELR